MIRDPTRWLAAILALVAAAGLVALYASLEPQSHNQSPNWFVQLLVHGLPDAIVVLIAIPIVYFIFELPGIDPLGKKFDQISSFVKEIEKVQRIYKYGAIDSIFRKRYEGLRLEMDQLADGIFKLADLDDVYEDDIRSMENLHKGDELLSTCPVVEVSDEARLEQINHLGYVGSMKAHKTAAQRGVNVTRIYLFRCRDDFSPEELRKHLLSLSERNFAIKICFCDELRIEPFDFLVFDNSKVSVGDTRGFTGIVKSGTIYLDKNKINECIEHHKRVSVLCQSIEEILRSDESS